MRGAFSLRANG